MGLGRAVSETNLLNDDRAFGPTTSNTPGGLIDFMLVEQGDLTAVERFAQFHTESEQPLQGRYYSSLMPAAPPGPGQQLAFEVDLDRCSGCKACVVACHSLNGLDDGEAWRDVGLIVGGTPGLPILQHVTSSCHHCLDPACLNACPVDAYEKDPITGIVKHLDDQCFGCQYCTLACPYDAPKFHPGLGIVRKCDMCAGRLQAGEAPACVQACPHEAIRIRVVDRAEVIAHAETGSFLRGAPDPSYTMPTTRYLTNRSIPGITRPADHFRNVPEHAHWPLVWMLVLTQMSVGGFALDLARRLAGYSGSPVLAGLSLGFGLLGLTASLAHLGRPLYAYRALIGLRHSWLSREVAAFGLFANLAIVHCGLIALAIQSGHAIPSWASDLLATLAVGAGAAGVACSVMVYHVVRRPFWRAPSSGVKFFGTALVLGLALALLASSVARAPGFSARTLAVALSAAVGAKLLFESALLLHLRDPQLSPLRRSALRVCGPLARMASARLAFGALGGFILTLPFIGAGSALSPAWRLLFATLALFALFSSEIAERYLFFAAVVRPKMPGGLLR